VKLKLDENVDARLAVLLRQAGHETTTVRDQRLLGMADSVLYERCASEGHILVTLDLGFSNVLRFPPERTPGLVVLRGPDDLFPTVRILVQTLANALTTGTPSGHLWIVEPGRLRIHEPTFETDT
jgi:predicted nuclease of predicted toxin-antitoxin system